MSYHREWRWRLDDDGQEMDCYKFQLLVLQLNIISNWLPVRQQAVCLSESLQKVTANVFYPPFSCRLGGGFMRADWLARWCCRAEKVFHGSPLV